MPLYRARVSPTLFAATASKTVANTTSETSLFGTGVGSLTLPANFLKAGNSLWVNLRGHVSETGTPTLQFKLKYGSTVLLDLTALTLPGLLSSSYLEINFIVTCRSTGATGTVFTQGKFIAGTAILDVASTAAVTIDTTAATALDATAAWGTADPADTLTITNSTLEHLAI